MTYWICVCGATRPSQPDKPPCLLCNFYIFSPCTMWVICMYIYLYLCVGDNRRLLMGALHSRPMVAALFVRAVVVRFSAAAGCRALADVVIPQVDLLCVPGDDGWLWPWGQHVLQLLRRDNIQHNAALTDSLSRQLCTSLKRCLCRGCRSCQPGRKSPKRRQRVTQLQEEQMLWLISNLLRHDWRPADRRHNRFTHELHKVHPKRMMTPSKIHKYIGDVFAPCSWLFKSQFGSHMMYREPFSR